MKDNIISMPDHIGYSDMVKRDYPGRHFENGDNEFSIYKIIAGGNGGWDKSGFMALISCNKEHKIIHRTFHKKRVDAINELKNPSFEITH